MNHADLIKKLSTNLQSVQVKKFGLKEYFYALASGFFSILAAVAITGIRNDLQIMMATPRYVFELFLLTTLAISSLVAVFALSIPSLSKAKATQVASISFGAWLVVLILFFVKEKNPIMGWSFSCVEEIFITSLAPALVLFLLVKNIHFTQSSAVGWFMLLSSAAFGAIATHLCCPASNAEHILIWHALPVLMIGFAGRFVSNYILKKL